MQRVYNASTALGMHIATRRERRSNDYELIGTNKPETSFKNPFTFKLKPQIEIVIGPDNCILKSMRSHPIQIYSHQGL